MNFAALVRANDPDRYLAAMTASEPAQQKLMVLYAFNLEIARAPWASAEPMIAEMRLQWWLDVIGDIYEGRGARGHEVSGPLAGVIAEHDLSRGIFDRMIEARQFDVYREPHTDRAAFDGYIMATSAGLIEIATRVLDRDADITPVRRIGYAMGVANLLRAAPELIGRGRQPLLNDMQPVIGDALNGLGGQISSKVFPAVLAGWRARATLQAAQKNPDRILTGGLEESPAWRRFSFTRSRLQRRL